MSLTPDAVIAYIAQHGPAVPNQIRQALAAQDNFVVGAVLSELAGSGKLALTRLTHGTSKFYYDPKHPELLEALGVHLGEKDRRAFELLKEQRVVRHSELSALNRAAIAVIADFSRVLPVETPTGEERFWRYYLVSEDEAFDMIVARWFPSHVQKKESKSPEQTPQAIEPPQTKVIVAPEPVSALATAPTVEAAPVAVTAAPITKQKTRKASKLEKRTADTALETKKPKVASSTKTKRAPAAPSDFSQGIADYFGVRNIKLDEDLGSTKIEMTALVRVPSAIGEMRYFCKAKTKKITTDGDLASAFLEAQSRGLPLLYLAAGTLSKKSQEALPTLKGAVVAKPFASQEAENY